MHQEVGNSGMCVLQWADATKQGRPAIVLTEEFYKNYVKPIQGKDYAQVPGLIKIARDAGYAPIRTALVQAATKENNQMVIWAAEIFDPYSKHDYWWQGHADCTPENVSNQKLAKSFVRIGETRAIGRALRFALGIDMVCFEELSDVDDKEAAWGPADKPNSTLPLPERKEKIVIAPPQAPAKEKAPATAAAEEGIPIKDDTLAAMKRLIEEDKLTSWIQLRDYAQENFNKSSRNSLTEAEGQQVITWLNSLRLQDAVLV